MIAAAWSAGSFGAGAKRMLSGTEPVASRRAYVPEVDALRGLAMTAVIAFHCKLMPFGWMGVWIFYVVSGFSVATSVLSRERLSVSRSQEIGRFYIRRMLRIWPLYFGFVGLNVVVLEAMGNKAPLEDLPWLLTFTQNLKMILVDYLPKANWPAFGHLWTLAVEQQFYLVFPLLMVLRRRSTRGLVLSGIIAFALFLRAATGQWALGMGYDPGRIAFAVYAFGPAHFDAFAAGCLIALFREEIAVNRRLALAAFAVTATITVAYLGTYAAIGVREDGHFSVDAMRNIVSGILDGQGREITVYLIPTCIAATILIGILSKHRVCLLLCRIPGLQAIGRVSYGGYLFHVPVLMVVGTFVVPLLVPFIGTAIFGSRVTLFVFAFPLTAACAWVSFIYFEQPFLRIAQRGRAPSARPARSPQPL
jgi:peptidoglycan/LPS O-acetylase OafA/YrhL